jgi:hypothetical protein
LQASLKNPLSLPLGDAAPGCYQVDRAARVADDAHVDRHGWRLWHAWEADAVTCLLAESKAPEKFRGCGFALGFRLRYGRFCGVGDLFDVLQGVPECAQGVERVFQRFLFLSGAATVKEFSASHESGAFRFGYLLLDSVLVGFENGSSVQRFPMPGLIRSALAGDVITLHLHLLITNQIQKWKSKKPIRVIDVAFENGMTVAPDIK